MRPEPVVAPAPIALGRPTATVAAGASLAQAMACHLGVATEPPRPPAGNDAADAVAACLRPADIMGVLLGTAPPASEH